jgi:superfamily I DNA/RNA helicase/RecB family exonuclease
MSPLSFDPSQTRVLEHARGALLVTGGPGTGKTTLLLERFARLIEDGADPDRMVLLCLSRRGAQSARARLFRRLGRSLPDLPVLTWHGLALRVLGQRFEALEYAEPPRLLTAPEQYGRVAELLGAESPEDWPTLGRYLGLNRFGREVADFVLRSQERLLQPEDLMASAEAAGRADLAEVSRFYGRYVDAIGSANEVDFAGLLNQAVAAAEKLGGPDLEHVLVDDYQDVAPAAERLLGTLESGASTVVVAADPAGRVFSFRGATGQPVTRLAARGDVDTVALERCHRLADGPRTLCDALAAGTRLDGAELEAWGFAQPSEEADAVAREILRAHLEAAVPWGDVAIVVRRHGEYVAALRRALTHHGVPHVVSGEASALVSEPAVRPIVHLLRFALRPERREEVLEGLLVSFVVGLHPHDVRTLRRAARASVPMVSLLELCQSPPEDVPAPIRERLAALWETVELLTRQVKEERRPDEVFFALWERLPYPRGLVAQADSDDPAVAERANRDLDSLYAFGNSLSRFRERRPWSLLAEYLDALEQADFGPEPFVPPEDRLPDAVRILSAHRAHGEEFELAFVVGCLEGEFPSLSAPRPLVSVDDLDAPRTARERFEERFREERALFRLALSRGRRTVLTACESRDSRRPRTPTRFVPADAWGSPDPGPPPTLSQAEAEHRRTLADPDRPDPERLAALAGLAALGARPERWWGARDWTPGPPLHVGEFKTSYSRLSTFENCPLQYLYDTELGLDFTGSHHMWLGSRVHQVIEEFWNGTVERTLAGLERRLDELWRPEVFPSRAVEHRRRIDATRMFEKFMVSESEVPPAVVEHAFKFPLDGAILRGRIDAVVVMPEGLRVLDYKTGRSTILQKDAEEDLQLGAYLLAARRDPELRKLGNPHRMELVYLGTSDAGTVRRISRPTKEDVPKFEERIHGYLEEIRAEAFAPNPEAKCRNCAYRSLCPVWPEGAEVGL